MAKQLFKNIGFLTLSQAANYLLPLITIPYITRIVGPANYGLIEFATVVMLYFSAIVIYGFNTTATRKIAEHAHDPAVVAKVFSTVVFTRLFLFLASTAVFLVCITFIPQFKQNSQVLWFAYPIVLGWALYPDFLFQGLQKLQFVALANFVVKALAAVLIFVLIQVEGDFYLVLAINAVSQIVVGLVVLAFAFRFLKQKFFVRPNFNQIFAQLREGAYVFVSHFFTRISTFGIIVFLGLLLNDAQLGLFAAGMKLIIVAQSFLFLPLFGALFPYLTNLFRNNAASYWYNYKRAQRFALIATVIGAVILMAVPDFFVSLLFGAAYLPASHLLQIMAPILVATTISHFSMQQGLIILKKDKTYLAVVVLVGVISLPLNYFSILAYGLEGAAWAKLAGEVLLAVFGFLSFLYISKKQGASIQ